MLLREKELKEFKFYIWFIKYMYMYLFGVKFYYIRIYIKI